MVLVWVSSMNNVCCVVTEAVIMAWAAFLLVISLNGLH